MDQVTSGAISQIWKPSRCFGIEKKLVVWFQVDSSPLPVESQAKEDPKEKITVSTEQTSPLFLVPK